jgi:hypothetical protein
MKKRAIHVAATFYIIAALLVAHLAVAANQTVAEKRTNNQANMAAPSGLVRDYQRLDQPYANCGDSYFDGIFPIPVPAPKYIVRIWSSDMCSACTQYEREEVPALLKLKYKVEHKDYHKDSPPAEVQSLPTIQIIFKGKVVATKIYWKASDIDKFVKEQTSVK